MLERTIKGSMVLKRLLAATQQEGCIFSRQVKPDRLQLLLIARPLSLSSKNTATTKAQIRSGPIACNRQYAAIAVSVAVVDRQKPFIPGLKSPG